MASRSLGTRTVIAGSTLGAKPQLDKHKSSTRFVPDLGVYCGRINQEFFRETGMGNGLGSL